MSNFLPNEAERRVAQAHLSRVVSGGGLVMIACAIAAAIALVPAYISLRAEKEALSRQKEVFAQGLQTAQDNPNKTHILRTQAILGSLKSITSSGRVAEALQNVVKILPEDVAFNHVTYDAGSGLLVLSGETQHREHLAAYRESLRRTLAGSEVTIPLDELAGMGRGVFTITITGIR